MWRTMMVGIVAGALTLPAVAQTQQTQQTPQTPQTQQTPRAQQASKDLVETAMAAGSFQTLTKALKAADLVQTLKGPGPYTVFAPTDEAFAKLPPGKLDALMKAENKMTLQRILKYHVVSGRVPSSEVAKMRTVKTVSGDTLAIKTAEGAVMVENARVVKADVQASNGLIHVIDAVILPDESD